MLAFILADLLMLPILDIYRRHYGRRMMLFILATFYAAMAAAGLIVDLAFKPLRLERTIRNAKVVPAGGRPDHTTALNIIFLALAATLSDRFVRTGSVPMLKATNKPMVHHAMGGHEAHAPAAGQRS